MPERAAADALKIVKRLVLLMMVLSVAANLLVVRTSADARAQNCRVVERTFDGWTADVIDVFFTRERTPDEQVLLDSHLDELKQRTHKRLENCR